MSENTLTKRGIVLPSEAVIKVTALLELEPLSDASRAAIDRELQELVYGQFTALGTAVHNGQMVSIFVLPAPAVLATILHVVREEWS